MDFEGTMGVKAPIIKAKYQQQTFNLIPIIWQELVDNLDSFEFVKKSFANLLERRVFGKDN